ncbi:MAG: hypothetical protein ACPGWR_33965, partial [Ardenticatenaceae bacterium]
LPLHRPATRRATARDCPYTPNEKPTICRGEAGGGRGINKRFVKIPNLNNAQFVASPVTRIRWHHSSTSDPRFPVNLRF